MDNQHKKKWSKALFICLIANVFLTITFQLFLIYNFNDNDVAKISGDPKYYLKLINLKLIEGSFYPSIQDVNSDFMFSPGFINYAVLILNFFTSIKSLIWFNFLFIVFISVELYLIAKKIFTQSVAQLSVVLFLSSLNTQGISLLLLTQLPFAVMFLGAVLLILQKNIKSFFFAGILLVLANWIRPFGLFMLISFIVFGVTSKIPIKLYLSMFSSIFISIMVIGLASYSNSDYFVYQSTTSGINMRMGAHDASNGGYIIQAYRDNYNSPNLNFIQKDSVWKSKAINWIKEHPIEYLKLAPSKLIRLFSIDAYTLQSYKLIFFNINLNKTISHLLFKIIYGLSFLHHLFLLITTIVSWFFLKTNNNSFLIFCWVYIFLCIGVTCLTVGEPIYRHQLDLLFCVISAKTLVVVFSKFNKDKA